MFKLQFSTDNAAFDGGAEIEIARILRAIAQSAVGGFSPNGDSAVIRDANGNAIGSWSYEPAASDDGEG